MLRLTTDKKIDIMDAKNAPSARCKSGETRAVGETEGEQ